MNILYLCHRIPYPPNKGDKIRSFHHIQHLAKRHKIYLATILEKPSNNQYVQHLKSLCTEVFTVHSHQRWHLLKGLLFSTKPLTVCHFYHQHLQTYIDNVLQDKNIDVIICFCSSMAEYVFQAKFFIRKSTIRPKLIMDFVDLDSAKWQQYAEMSSFPKRPIFHLENDRLFNYELQVLHAFDRCFFASQREVDILKNENIDTDGIEVVENGIDFYFFTANQRQQNRHPVLLFTGAMDYYANVDAVRWFCKDILPLIRSEFPTVELKIVGMHPVRAIRKLAKLPSVEVTGYVKDIRPYYHRADVFVAPMRIARGVQNKILEAMATGNAVVATNTASAGINCQDNTNIMIAESADTFAMKVISLLKNKEKRMAMAREAIKNIRRCYVWEDKLQRLDELIQI